MEKMDRDMMEKVQQMQKKIVDHMAITKASNTDSEMVAMQRDILEMVQQLQKKIGDTEANITNSIDIKCSAPEDNVKHYINSVVFAYIDNLIHHVVIPTRESTSTMKSPNATSQEIGTSEVQQIQVDQCQTLTKYLKLMQTLTKLN